MSGLGRAGGEGGRTASGGGGQWHLAKGDIMVPRDGRLSTMFINEHSQISAAHQTFVKRRQLCINMGSPEPKRAKVRASHPSKTAMGGAATVVVASTDKQSPNPHPSL